MTVLFAFSGIALSTIQASAATTVGLNISTGGTLTVSGATALQGGVTVSDGTLLDLSSVQPTAGTNEGLKLPQVSGALGAPASGVGYLAYRTDTSALQYYDGAAWITVTTSTVSSTFAPSANNTYDLGRFGAAWKDVYVSGTATVTNLTVNGTCTGCGGGSSLSGGIANTLTFWNSTTGVGASATLTYNSSTGLFSNLGTVSSTAINTGNITAKNNNLFDLGAFGSAWKDIYSSGTVRIGTGTVIDGTTLTLAAASGFNVGKFFVDASGNVNASGTVRTASGITTGGTIQPIANNTTDIGAFGSAFKDVYVSGTARINTLSVITGLTPAGNNTTDLGAFGSAWKDVYASGSVRVGSGSASTTISSSGNITTTGSLLPATNNTSDIGAVGDAVKDIYSSGTTRLGTLSNDGNTTLGDSSADTITLNARFASTLNPNANNTLDLGTFGTAWKDIYASGTLRIGTGTVIDGTTLLLAQASGFNTGKFFVDASGNVNASGTIRAASGLTTGGTIQPIANNTTDIGAFGSAFKDVYVSGTARINTLSVITGLTPAGNNTTDLGSFGSAWKDIYASGSVRVGSGSASTTISSSGNITTTGSLFPATNNTSDIGATGDAVKDIYSSGTTRLGTLSNDGNTTLGDSSADTITLNARFASTLNPNANNTLDLGTFGTAWKDIYASGTLRIGTGTVIDGITLLLAQASGFNTGKFFVDASGNVNASGTVRTASGITTGGTIQPVANNTTDIGAFGSAFKDVYVSGTARVQAVSVIGSLAPATNNAIDLGSFGSAWKDIYASGSIRVGAGAASTTLSSSGNILTTGSYLPASNNASDLGAFGAAFRDVYVSGTTRLATTTLADNTLLNLSGIAPTTGVNEGLQLPQSTSLGNPGSGAGYLGYDTDNFQLQYYDGASWNAVVTSTAVALQGAYGNGNVVTTTDARDVSIVLADTTTDANLDVNLAATSTSSGDMPSFSTSTASRGVFRIHKDTQNLLQVDSSGTSTIFGTLNVNYPIAPVMIASSTNVGPFSNPPYAALVSGNLFYSGTPTGGLGIYDVSDPRKPIKLSTDLSSSAIGLPKNFFLVGKYLISGSDSGSNNTSGLYVIDVSNPTTPTVVFSDAYAGVGTTFGSVYVFGRYAYFASSGTVNGLFVYDISNPRNPRIVGKITGSDIRSITGQGRYIYADLVGSGGVSSLRVYDVLNPAAPRLVGTLTASGLEGMQMQIVGDRLYIGSADTNNRNIKIVDISNPTSPSLKSSFMPPDCVSNNSSKINMAVRGRYAYVVMNKCPTTGTGGIAVYDVSSSTVPTILSVTQRAGSAFGGIMVSGRYAYLSGDSGSSAFAIYSLNGADISTASIGGLAADEVTVAGNLDVGNRITSGGGITVGAGGIQSFGDLSIYSEASSTAFRIDHVNIATFGEPAAAIAYQAATSTGLMITASSSNFAATGLNGVLRLDTTRVSSSLFNFFTANVAATGSATATVFRIDGLGSMFASGTTYLGGSPNANTLVASQVTSGTLAYLYSQSSSTPTVYIKTSSTEIAATGLDALLRIDAVTSTLPFRYNFITANWGNDGTSATNSVFAVRGDGQIFSDAGTTITSPADLAELTKVNGDFADYPDGTIVSQSPDDEEVAMVATPSIGNVLGIATDRGVFMGSGRWGKDIQSFPGNIHDFEAAHNVRRISVAGYVKVRVNDENGPIHPGDPLGLSDTTPGEARRAKQGDLIVGMARASFPPKAHATPPGEGSPSATLTNETEEVLPTDDTTPAATEDATTTTATATQEVTTTVSHGLVETIVGNGAGLAIQQAQFHNQGIVETPQGSFENGSISLLTNGPSTISQLIVKDIASIHGDLKVKGHAIFNEDTAGLAKFLVSTTSVAVHFAQAYDTAPVVSVTPEARVIGTWWVETVAPEGFTIRIEKPQAQVVLFHWIALGVKEKQLFVSDGTHGPSDQEYLWGQGDHLPTVVDVPTPRVQGDTVTEEPAPLMSSESAPAAPAATEEPAADTAAPTDTAPVDGAGGPDVDEQLLVPYVPFTRA